MLMFALTVHQVQYKHKLSIQVVLHPHPIAYSYSRGLIIKHFSHSLLPFPPALLTALSQTEPR